jgi:hypothetical protein
LPRSLLNLGISTLRLGIQSNSNGYQRLLTFEVPGGGFSWFGEAPANKILTAYGLMEFSDMAKVSEADPRLIERTRDWLARQQQPDGSWKPDTSAINEGATDRYNSNVLRITAYIAWSLVNTGYRRPAVEKAKRFIQSQSDGKSDTYTLAIIANFAADYGEDRDFTRQSMQALLDGRSESGDQVSWTSEKTGVYSTGSSAAIETTGLATQALLKWGQASETVRKALDFISSKKEASGNWGTTQATIMALRSLLLASQLSTSDVRGAVQVILNGKPVETLRLTAENNDLLHQFAFRNIDTEKPNLIQLKFEGTGGGLAYQVVGRYFTPWEGKPAAEPLSIDIVYDRTKLARTISSPLPLRFATTSPRPRTWSWSILVFRPASTCSAKTCNLSRKRPPATKRAVWRNSASPPRRRSSTSTRCLRSKP